MNFYQFANMFTFWTFILFSLTFIVWTPVEGQSEVIGSTQPIIASLGDDVILPCHLDPVFNVQELTVEWSKPDLKPDPSDPLSRDEYVHLYRHRHEDSDMKLPEYINRTDLFTDELKHGNISLKITNVTLADEGKYRCFVPSLKSRVDSAIVELVVVGGRQTWIILISAVVICCVLLMIGGLVGGYLFKQWRQKPGSELVGLDLD